MTPLACRPEDTRGFAGLGSSAMATKTKGTPKATASDAPKVAPTLGQQLVRALVPLSEMFGYVGDLRSKTQGRASYSMQFDSYAQVPNHVATEIIAKARGE